MTKANLARNTLMGEDNRTCDLTESELMAQFERSAAAVIIGEAF